MKLAQNREWFEKRIPREEGEIGAGTMKQLGIKESVKRGLITEEQALMRLNGDKSSHTFGWLTRRIVKRMGLCK